MTDARTGKRFPLGLPVQIHASGAAEEQPGTTANISRSGVYIRAELPEGEGNPDSIEWQQGAVVDFDITLPAEAVAAEHDIRIRCQGRVVRVDKIKGEQSRRGVACVIDTYEFLREP